MTAVIAFFAFVNSLGGEFVYDDNRQILMNPTIQQATLYAKALTSDVWAFKGDGSISASNYYRPVFVLWMIINFALFGAVPFGWHLSSVAIHICACLLSFKLLRQLGFSDGISFTIAALFAVHPARVENVSWISGSPDILLSLFFIASIVLVLQERVKGNRFNYLASIVLYALALGTKEIAMLLFPIYFLAFRFREEDPLERPGVKTRDAISLTAPYAILALIFFMVRLYVVGGVTHPVEDAPTMFQAIISLPSVFLFYLRQVIVPLFLAENYPLRPENGITIGFLVSAVASLFIVVFAWRLCRKSSVRQFGALLFILPLLPALYIGAFPSEQIVHDRYLYLPLLGFLIVVGSLVIELLPASVNWERMAALVATVIVVVFGIQTVSYNRVWKNNFDLWEYNVRADPNSSSSLAYFASELSGRGRFAEAVAAYDRSLEIKESTLALMGRARNLVPLGRNDEAVDSAMRVIQLPNEKANAYTLYQAYEAAAIAYTSSGRSGDAETLIRDARDRLPIYRAALTDKLAIILYNQGKKEDALKELNSVRDQARREMLPASKSVFLRIGMLEMETGNVPAAKRDLEEYLALSKTFSDNESLNSRRQAAATLARIR